jgi:hypothetical protein
MVGHRRAAGAALAQFGHGRIEDRRGPRADAGKQALERDIVQLPDSTNTGGPGSLLVRGGYLEAVVMRRRGTNATARPSHAAPRVGADQPAFF